MEAASEPEAGPVRPKHGIISPIIDAIIIITITIIIIYCWDNCFNNNSNNYKNNNRCCFYRDGKGLIVVLHSSQQDDTLNIPDANLGKKSHFWSSVPYLMSNSPGPSHSYSCS